MTFLGMRLALIEIKLGLLRFIQNFNFKAAKGFETVDFNTFSIFMKFSYVQNEDDFYLKIL